MKVTPAKDILNLIAKPWANTQDIMSIGSVGRGTALEIKRKIRIESELNGLFLPKNLVKMEDVVKFFDLNINYLKRVKEEADFEK